MFGRLSLYHFSHSISPKGDVFSAQFTDLLFLVVLWFELRALCLLSKLFAT
jgi:hypothetical protein